MRMTYHEHGAALITALVFLLILTILGISAMQMSILEERMAGNTRDLTIAFEAAESALRDGELDVLRNIDNTVIFHSDCSGGLCLPTTTSTPNSAIIDWGNNNFTRVYGANTGATLLANVNSQPRYIIERIFVVAPPVGQSLAMGITPTTKPSAYRITALGFGGSAESRVMLTSIFIK